LTHEGKVISVHAVKSRGVSRGVATMLTALSWLFMLWHTCLQFRRWNWKWYISTVLGYHMYVS